METINNNMSKKKSIVKNEEKPGGDDNVSDYSIVENDHDDQKTVASYSDDTIASAEADLDNYLATEHNGAKRSLEDIFSSGQYTRPNGDPNTNLIDLFAGRPYCLPDQTIPKFFKFYNQCYKSKINMMWNEKQLDYSGIMLDFDIYQDMEKSQLNEDIIETLIQHICILIKKIIELPEKLTTMIAVSKKPSVEFRTEKNAYKDGIHILIPGIKVRRSVKKLLITEILSQEVLNCSLIDVEPSTKINREVGKPPYSRRDFLDINSAHVPVFLVGSSSKKGKKPYELVYIYKVTINNTPGAPTPVMTKQDINMLNDKAINKPYEFSLNWECEKVEKKRYEVRPEFVTQIQSIEKSFIDRYREEVEVGNMLSLYSINNKEFEEIQLLVDTLNPQRADDYKSWLEVLFVLANTSPLYKEIARKFSQKSPKYKSADFERVWNQIMAGSTMKKRGLTIGSLYFWAQKDNPERYKQIRQNQILSKILSTTRTWYNQGRLSHHDLASILYDLLKDKYVCSTPPGEKGRFWYEFIVDGDQYSEEGELYKWRCTYQTSPTSLSIYISKKLGHLCSSVHTILQRKIDEAPDDQIRKWHINAVTNLGATMRNLGNSPFKKNIMIEAEVLFNKDNFAKNLDKDPYLVGVANGILKLPMEVGEKPILITGYHNYLVSKYTNVNYIPFNPYDPETKKLIYVWRELFPNNEPDTHEFILSLLASTLDSNDKESIFTIIHGGGANGKSTIMELHLGSLGTTYIRKGDMAFLTSINKNAETASPMLMSIKDANLMYFSESDLAQTLNISRIKEITGLETISARKLHKDQENFRPHCHYIALTNNDFTINASDWGAWRRIVKINLKMSFRTKRDPLYKENDPYVRRADETVQLEFIKRPTVRGKYLGYLVWFYYWLQRKYNGKVMNIPHKNIEIDTFKYRKVQDFVNNFLSVRCVQCDPESEEQIFKLEDEAKKFVSWNNKMRGVSITIKSACDLFMNSQLSKKIENGARGMYLNGYRFLDDDEEKKEGEVYFENVVMGVDLTKNIVEPETPDQYYDRICKEFDQYKDIFSDNIDENTVQNLIETKYIANTPTDWEHNASIEIEKKNEDVPEGQVMDSGIVLAPIQEVNYSKSGTVPKDKRYVKAFMGLLQDLIKDHIKSKTDDDGGGDDEEGGGSGGGGGSGEDSVELESGVKEENDDDNLIVKPNNLISQQTPRSTTSTGTRNSKLKISAKIK